VARVRKKAVDRMAGMSGSVIDGTTGGHAHKIRSRNDRGCMRHHADCARSSNEPR
jgi:hypothetical protein